MGVGVQRAGGVVGLSLQLHGAGIAAVQAGDLGQEGGLAGAVLADDPADLAALQVQVDVHVGVGGAEVLVQPADLKDLLAHYFTTPFLPQLPMMPKMIRNAPRQASCRVPEGMPIRVRKLKAA